MSKVTVVLQYFVISVHSIRVIEQSSVYTSLSKQFHLSEHLDNCRNKSVQISEIHSVIGDVLLPLFTG